MGQFFHSLIYQPIYNTLVFFYDVIPGQDFGIAIILTTILLKLLMFPLSKKQIETQRVMQVLQPKIKELQAKHKDNKEEQTKALLELYKSEKANPLSGCLPLIVQIIFLIAIYRVIINISQAGFTIIPGDLYAFVQNPGLINHLFFSWLDLSKPSYLLAALSAAAQYFQTKMLLSQQKPPLKIPGAGEQPDFAAIMNKQMLYLGPGITLFIGVTFPAALSLYWLVSNLFMLGQQKLLFQEAAKSQK